MGEQVLPEAEDLPVGHLVATLRQTAASYKFYWFLAILEAVKQDIPQPVPMDFLLSQMVALAWHPTVFFKLSFGPADRLAKAVLELQAVSKLKYKTDINDVAKTAQTVLTGKGKSALKTEIQNKSRYVPYRFLQPWFAQQLVGVPDGKVNGAIVSLATNNFQNHQNLPVYKFADGGRAIELQPRWRGYLKRHFGIVRNFIDWNLAQYLQRLNPNVPAIPNKLFPQSERGDLNLARDFWSRVPDLRCIYSGQPLELKRAEIDHFLPWSFVAHDLLWNLIPVSADANSKKNNAIPDLGHYLPKLANAHFAAIRSVLSYQNAATRKLLEDYQILMGVKAGVNLSATEQPAFLEVYRHTFIPMAEIAENMGFQANWVYS